ncbi:MAG: PH domain-containing protein [Bacilli bacterium]|nr:PH domain-containing protein [Bacilli bacterium]
MGNSVYKQVLKFKEKYPMTIGWRIRENSDIVERHLNPDEHVIYAFIAQKNDNPFNIFNSAVVALTNKRILIGRKRVLVGYFLNSITPDMYNDMKISSGLIWGKIYIDTIKEFVALTNIAKDALTEIETQITSYMMEEKKKYGKRDEEEKD